MRQKTRIGLKKWQRLPFFLGVPKSLSVRRYKDPNRPALKFVVNVHGNGKRIRKFFTTKVEAQTFVQQKNFELLNQGREGIAVPSWLRIMAQREHERLQPHGKTITDAVRFLSETP